MPSIPSTNWRISNDDQHVIEYLQSGETSKGSIINEEQHEALMQALVSDENSEFRDPLSNHIIRMENHFGLQDTFKRTMNGSLWKGQVVNIFSLKQNSTKIYSSPKPFVKMKPNKLLEAK